MRNPFKDYGGADDWFDKLWTAEIPKGNDCLYGNAGTDMLYNSLCVADCLLLSLRVEKVVPFTNAIVIWAYFMCFRVFR